MENREEMTYSDPGVMTNDFLVASDGSMGISVLPLCDCSGNSLINAAGGGRAFIDTEICLLLL